jgi:hypothetical protein
MILKNPKNEVELLMADESKSLKDTIVAGVEAAGPAIVEALQQCEGGSTVVVPVVVVVSHCVVTRD